MTAASRITHRKRSRPGPHGSGPDIRRPAPAPVGRKGALSLAGRVAAALVGNYGLTAAAAMLAAVLLAGAGLARSEAAMLAMMLAPFLYVGVALWAFHAQRIARAWALIAGAGGACYLLARLLAPLIAGR